MKKKVRQLINKYMIFKDTELLSNLYAGIVKQQLLNEAKEPCCPCTEGKKCTKKGCNCKACVKSLNEAKKAKKDKPDYLDVDKDGNKKESMKKALKDKPMKESSSFKELYNQVMTEAVVCGTKVNSQHQYNCVTKDGEEKVLKGESVVMMKDKLRSVKPAHKK